MSRRSAMSGAPMRNAESSGPGMAARPGRKSSSSATRREPSDLCMDPNNPRILYAGFWQVYRKPWTLESRRPRRRRVADGRRGRHVEEARRRAARRGRRKRRRGGLGRPARPCLGDRRGREGRSLSQRGRRREMDEDELGEQAAPAGLVLLEDLRGSEERRRGLRPEHRDVPQQRRRQDLHADPRAARRQPRPVDRSGRSESDDQLERRRRERLLQCRPDLVVGHEISPRRSSIA